MDYNEYAIITFEKPFASLPTVLISPYDTTNDNYYMAKIAEISKQGFTLYTDKTTNQGYFWIAIGK